MADLMTFPETVDEFMEQYKIVDTEHVYTNGAEMVPIFRMKQWFEHLPDVVPVVRGAWKQHYVGGNKVPWGSDCSLCGEWLVIDRLVMSEKYHYCPNCGAKMDGGADNG